MMKAAKTSPPTIGNILGALIAAFATFCAWYLLLNHDVGAYFSYAERMLLGEKLYLDISEVNTPLTSYFLVPLVWLKNATNLAYTDSFFVLVGLLIYCCAQLSIKTIAHIPFFQEPKRYLIFCITIFFALFIPPSLQGDFGQREHFFIALFLPYLMLMVANDWAISCPKKIKVSAGVLAGIGCSIKPNFIILFAFVELARLAMHGKLMHSFRIESLLISGIFIFYHSWFAFFFPEYWSGIKIFMDAYSGFRTSIDMLVAKAVLYLFPSIIFIAFIFKQKIPIRRVCSILAAFCGAVVLYLTPQTGYFYHLMPALTLLLLIGCFLLIQTRFIAMALLLIALWSIPSFIALTYNDREIKLDLAAKIRTIGENERIAVLSTSVSPAFPAVNYANTIWNLTVAHLIQLPTAYKEVGVSEKEPDYHDLNEMGETERYYTLRYLDDLEKRPALIMIDEREQKQGLIGQQFNILNYFLTQERFRALWKDYRYIGTLHDFAFYKYEPAAKP